MPASICHPQASFMRSCTSSQPKFTKFTTFTKCSFALFSPFHQLPSFHHGLQAIAVTITPIKGNEMISSTQANGFQQAHTTIAAVYHCQSSSKIHQLRKATSVALSQILRTSQAPCYLPGPFHVFTSPPCVLSICSELTSSSGTKRSV